jgi:Sigma-54 interaction domain
LSENKLALVLVWCSEAPERIGEVLLPPSRELVRDRPGRSEPTEPLATKVLSPEELAISVHGQDFVEVTSLGGTKLRHDDREVTTARVAPNGTLQIGSDLLFLCVRRPSWSWALGSKTTAGAFGRPDEDGIAGESPAVWDLRHRIASVGPRTEHVLVCGEGGTGRELVARAIHRASRRRRRFLVAANAAAMADPLAELFGNGEGYPRPGMPERQGLVGQAEGSTLLLEGVDELSDKAWSRLGRMLETGEYQRVADSRVAYADVRVVATTSRPSAVTYEIGSWLELRVDLPGLDARREDIPLIARCLAERGAPEAERAPFTLELVRALVSHHYLGHVRELEALLSKSVRASDPGWLPRGSVPSVRPLRRTSIPLNEIPPPPSKRPAPRVTKKRLRTR